ncbi:MAG: sigma-70 family RNA polymerase sigma factor, partial [Acidobacteriota bacterium]|nr:sigma-70 family RNA polymerase sigma factor [Acidobacteriota bacterium]
EGAQDAWTEFLERYGPIILQAVRRTIWDGEGAADCFVFVCEQLNARGYRRLLQFKPEGATGFVTWLRVVVRNLALDWYRKQVGRHRKFDSVERLPLLHQEIYRFRYEEGRSLDDTFLALRGRFPQLTSDAVSDADVELRQSFSSRQEWLLASRQSETVAIDSTDSADSPSIDVADSTRGPEDCAISHEEWQRLGRGLAKLDAPERLLLQLRFGRGATLAKIARLVGLPDAQTADRKIRATLDRLRKELE